MNQAAKDAVKFLGRMKWEQANRTCAFHTDERDDAIIAGLELLRGVAEGTHVIRPKRRDHKSRLRQIAGEPVDFVTLITTKPSKFRTPRNDNGE